MPNETDPVVTVMVAVSVDVAPEHAERAERIISSYFEHGTVRDGLHEAFGECGFEWQLDALYAIEDEREAALATRRAFHLPPPPSNQFIVTLDDGRQVAYLHGDVMVRSTIGGLWPSSTPQSTRPHQPGTWYRGEW